jgi:N-acetylglucosaminyldiphosphoundecaprenol N-acetyl-beta-D-mannosaminyltransferase
MNDLPKIKLLGIDIVNATEPQVLEFITKGLEKQSDKYYIVTPNPELLVIASTDKEYKKILNNARLALADGVGLILACRLLRKPLKQRITGVDLVENLCLNVANQPITVGFLGSGPGIAVLTAECLQKKYPGLKVVLTESEWAQDLKGAKIDILFVAFGSPKQEIWISKNIQNLPVKVVIGVGGAFDFISGKVPRAPKVLRSLGLEWLFRLILQPWRVKRQISLINFIFLVFEELIKGSKISE